MLWTIAGILIILWALGMVSGYVMGPFIHVLLVLALGIILVRIIQGRRRGTPVR
jgi:hypothetical protein